jgi:hypothetical protein
MAATSLPQDRETLPQQLIDVRDLARFVLDDHVGTYNVVSRRGHTTTPGLLEACVASAGAPGTRLGGAQLNSYSAASRMRVRSTYSPM